MAIDRTIVAWRAWYTDKRVFDSETTRWEDLPAIGVLFIRLYYKTRPYGRYMSGSDYYWRSVDGTIYGHDHAISALIPQECWDADLVKQGTWATDQAMVDAMDSAVATETAPNENERIDAT